MKIIVPDKLDDENNTYHLQLFLKSPHAVIYKRMNVHRVISIDVFPLKLGTTYDKYGNMMYPPHEHFTSPFEKANRYYGDWNMRLGEMDHEKSLIKALLKFKTYNE